MMMITCLILWIPVKLVRDDGDRWLGSPFDGWAGDTVPSRADQRAVSRPTRRTPAAARRKTRRRRVPAATAGSLRGDITAPLPIAKHRTRGHTYLPAKTG